MHLHARAGAVEFGEVLFREVQVGCAETLVEACEAPGAEDGHDRGLLREERRQRNRPDGRFRAFGNGGDEVDEGEFALEGFALEEWQVSADLSFAELGGRRGLAGEEPATERAVRDEPDTEFVEGGRMS